MKIRPKNKYLLVEKIEETKPAQNAGFALPNGYTLPQMHVAVKVIDVSSDSHFADAVNNWVVVPTNMLEEITIFGVKCFFVSETAIYAVVYE